MKLTLSAPAAAPMDGGEIGPPIIRVTMGERHAIAIRGVAYSLTRHENERGEGFGVVAIAHSGGMALYFEHNAASLRDLAAACLNCADKLDGGRGKQ